MASIGGRTVLNIEWNREELGESYRDISPPWGDGHAFQEMGLKAEPGQALTMIDLMNAAACRSEFTTYKAMQGPSLITVVDDHGNTVYYVKVKRVWIVDQHKNENAVGGINGGDYMLVCGWLLQETAIP